MEENSDLQKQLEMIEKTMSEQDTAPIFPKITENTQDKKVNLQQIIKRDMSNDVDSNVINTFNYYTIDGELLYKIVEQKSGERFIVQRKEGNLFEYGLNGVSKIPYNLPKLRERPNQVVWILNGEDKVDVFNSLGILSTTAPFTSPKKWEKRFNAYLYNTKGVIVLDENKENQKLYVRNTFSSINEDGINVGVVELKDIALLLGIQLEENSTILHLVQKLQDKEKLKEMLLQIEQQILI